MATRLLTQQMPSFFFLLTPLLAIHGNSPPHRPPASSSLSCVSFPRWSRVSPTTSPPRQLRGPLSAGGPQLLLLPVLVALVAPQLGGRGLDRSPPGVEGAEVGVQPMEGEEEEEEGSHSHSPWEEGAGEGEEVGEGVELACLASVTAPSAPQGIATAE